MTFALTAMLLAGCASSGNKTLVAYEELPKPTKAAEIPADLKNCFDNETKFPSNKELTKRDIVHLLSATRKSEKEKAACGRRLIKWYATVSRRKT